MLQRKEFSASTESSPCRLSKMELTVLFCSELPTTGGMKAEARGEGGCKQDSCIGWRGGLDQSLQIFCKGPGVNTSGFVDLWPLLQPLSSAIISQKQPHVSVNECDCVPIKPYLWILKFEFHVIFML